MRAESGDVELAVGPRRGSAVVVRRHHGGGRDGHETNDWNAEMTPSGSSRLRTTRSTERIRMGLSEEKSSAMGTLETSASGLQGPALSSVIVPPPPSRNIGDCRWPRTCCRWPAWPPTLHHRPLPRHGCLRILTAINTVAS